MMNNGIINLRGLNCYIDEDGTVFLSLEAVAKGLGFTTFQANGAITVRWNTVYKHLVNAGYMQEVALNSDYKSLLPEFIPESVFYLLAMYAKNKTAREFQKYVAYEILPEIRSTGSYNTKHLTPEEIALKDKELNIRNKEADAELLNSYHVFLCIDTLSTQYKNIITAFAMNSIAGRELLPLPTSEKVVYSATEIGEILGITANKVGRIANAHGMKTDVFGEWRRTVATNGKELDTWVYYDTALPHFKEIIESE